MTVTIQRSLSLPASERILYAPPTMRVAKAIHIPRGLRAAVVAVDGDRVTIELPSGRIAVVTTNDVEID